MRRSMVILGACLVLALTMTGCSDDDDNIFQIPGGLNQTQITAIAQGTTTAVSAVSSLGSLFFGLPPSSSASGGQCVDVSAKACDSGFAEQCGPFSLNVIDCVILGFGELDGSISLDPNTGTATMNLTIDDTTNLDGTVTIIPDKSGCFQVGYALTVTNGGVETAMTGFLEQCVPGFPEGILTVVIFDFQVAFEWFFDATRNAEFVVLDLTAPKSAPLADCTFNLNNDTVNCS